MELSIIDADNWKNELLFVHYDFLGKKQPVIRAVANDRAFSIVVSEENLQDIVDWAKDILDEGAE